MSTLPDPPDEPAEAYKVLVARVGRKSPKIPADLLARHVLGVVPPEEWPARAEAMDALLRRVAAVKEDRLRVDARPEGGVPLGVYATGRRGSAARPYRTMICGVDPIDGRCDCPDFLKNSLGACKHLLVVLEHLYARPRVLRRALKDQARAVEEAGSGPRWDPIRPLSGPGDWLARVSWPRPPETRGRAGSALRWFAAGDDGTLAVADSFPDDPTNRLALVDGLLKAQPPPSRGLAHDPALRALLAGERDRLRWRVKRAPAPEEVDAALASLKRSLYPYQREGVGRFLAAGRLVLADDMGLGKTSQAIAACHVLHQIRRARRGLIIAPASLKPQWAREWAATSTLPVLVVDGSPAERRALYESRRSGFFIINYEQLIRDLDPIRAWGPDLVVLDEAQRIKNWSTKTALSVKGLAPPYRLVLTGTPMENRIEELASVVEWVDDMALEPKWRLDAVHSVREDGRKEVGGVRGLATLRERLRGCLLRRVRREVLDQLPPRTDVRVPVELTAPQREEHDALIPPIASLVNRSKSRPLTQPEFLRLMSLLTTQRIISNGLAQLRFEDEWPTLRARGPDENVLQGLSSPKLLELRQIVRQVVLEQGRKAVIFSQWRRMLALAHWAVNDLLAGAGLRAGFFTGAEGQRRRTQNIVDFHDDPRCRILFASDAGGVGLNLQHAANCVVNLELPWNPAVLEQRIGRIYRLGQSQPIDVFNLVSEEGIESRIADLVGNKQAFFQGLFDGETDAVQFDRSGSFLARVEEIYEASTTAHAPSPLDDITLDESEDPDLDDEVDGPLDDLLEAADESRDPVAEAPDETPADTEPGLVPTVPATGDDVRHLFGQLRIRREPTGHVIIEAPPEAAHALGALFEGMAALLRSAPASPAGNDPIQDKLP